MIDTRTEKLIRLADVQNLDWLPRRREGTKLHYSTVYRWVSYGLRGVQLEVINVGGALCTTEAALRRFFDSLATVGKQSTPPDIGAGHAQAERELAAAGI